MWRQLWNCCTTIVERSWKTFEYMLEEICIVMNGALRAILVRVQERKKTKQKGSIFLENT
jgi:hypothetical protein